MKVYQTISSSPLHSLQVAQIANIDSKKESLKPHSNYDICTTKNHSILKPIENYKNGTEISIKYRKFNSQMKPHL